MKIKSRIIIFCLVFLSLSYIVYSQSYTGCIPCVINEPVFEGHGAASSTDPRRVVNLRIDTTWGTNTPASLWNATCAGSRGTGCDNASGPSAINMWNSVGTWYFFQLNQASDSNNTMDIQITRDSTWPASRSDACAYTNFPLDDPVTNGGSQLRVIHLPPGSENWSQQQLACILAHEIGHTIGLDHADNSGNCSGSIMHGIPGKDCSANCNRTQISPSDVEAANQQAADRTKCNLQQVPASTRPIVVGGGVTDPNPFRYNPTCYYYYEPLDIYRLCLCERTICQCEHGDYQGVEYLGTVYRLTDYFCYY